MNKKLLLAILVLSVGLGAKVYSLGIGVQFNMNAPGVFAPGVSVLYSQTRNTHFAVNWNFGETTNTVGLTADLWFFNPSIVNFKVGSLGFFLGGGLYAQTVMGKDFDLDYFDYNLGLRVPVGVNVKLMNNLLEVFVQVAPSIGVSVYPEFGFDDHFTFPMALGLRFWFGK